MRKIEIQTETESGKIIVLATCFDEDGTIRLEGDRRLIDRLNTEGVTILHNKQTVSLMPPDGSNFFNALPLYFRGTVIWTSPITQINNHQES